MSDTPLLEFFDSLLDDEVERKIVKRLLEGRDEGEIIEDLLGTKQEEK